MDGWLTNSKVLHARGFAAAASRLGLERSSWYDVADEKPRAYVMLGVNPSEMRCLIFLSEHFSIFVAKKGRRRITRRHWSSATSWCTLGSRVRRSACSLRLSARSGESRDSRYTVGRIVVQSRVGGLLSFNRCGLVRFEEYADVVECCWRGRLKSGDISALYARAAVRWALLFFVRDAFNRLCSGRQRRRSGA